MCFVEFIGYLCGHGTVAVNRPCPLTTHLHNNPCCSRPAARPFLAHTMCYSCLRIIHGRKNDINEYEHRWMHERGACDCEVKFPGLQQPRLIKRSSIVEGESAATGSSAFPTQTKQSSHPGQGESSTVPLYMEAQVGDSIEVAVRLPSVYGAEWTKDHAKVHESGKCKCPVSFERYKPLDIDYDQDEDDCLGPDHSESSNQTWYPMNSQHPNAPTPISPTYSHHEGAPNTARNSTNDPQYLYRHNQLPPGNVGQYPYGYNEIPTGNVARWAGETPQKSILDEILGPVRSDASVHGGRPVDFQTMHYSNLGTPIAGYPIACETPQSVYPSIIEFPQPERTIAGFPIGAGPEGDSHAGDFETCSLNTSTQGSPVTRRRLSSEF